MKKNKLFIDSSVNPQTKNGFSAYLYIEEDQKNSLTSKIKTKMFENTSSTKLELQGFLWALNDIDIKNTFITIYTDCQNILGLNQRREKFEKNNYLTKKGTLINNHDLYKEFYNLTDNLSYEIIKVKGHKKTNLKDEIDDIFTLVDKASRNKLREFNICINN